ncbi:XRE family transcriptional regulator [Neptunomonas japonica]|uniref:Peptidase S24 n=1 Tax=Neptunomonas japonica JAMM 1380 TaxID=1441457 RepID=A0A7R6SVB1_9GAMM|nr:S24 family peptidase [Neptunomonas japonica]BBB29354.1 peptidase S24 [Neptunomonas japonica JAMM 1380]
MNKTFSERLTEARESLRMSQSELARKMNVTPQAVQQWESSTTPRQHRVDLLAKILGVSASFLLFGANLESENQVNEKASISYLPSKFVQIPILDASLAAGAGSYVTDDVIKEYMPMDRAWLERYQVDKERANIVPIRGESMEPTLMSGDLLLINTAIHKPISGKIFAFDFDGDLRIKRFNKRLDGSWLISSDNDDKNLYRDETVSSHNIDQLRVIGQAVTIVERNLL